VLQDISNVHRISPGHDAFAVITDTNKTVHDLPSGSSWLAAIIRGCLHAIQETEVVERQASSWTDAVPACAASVFADAALPAALQVCRVEG